MNENLADEIRKTIESIKDMKTQVSGLNNYLGILEGMVRADIQKKVDDAYQRGLEDGKKAFDLLDAERDSEYQRGLNEAWEAARRIIHMPEGDLLNIFTECYSAVCTALQVLLKYDAAEAIDKLKAYEEKQKADDSIIAGHEVKAEDGTAVFFVTWMSDRCICGIDKEGKCYSYEPKEICGKTGRHFDIILEEKRE